MTWPILLCFFHLQGHPLRNWSFILYLIRGMAPPYKMIMAPLSRNDQSIKSTHILYNICARIKIVLIDSNGYISCFSNLCTSFWERQQDNLTISLQR